MTSLDVITPTELSASTEMKPDHQVQIIFASMPSEVDEDKRLAQLLKQAKRGYKFRCVSVKKVDPVVKPRARKSRPGMWKTGG